MCSRMSTDVVLKVSYSFHSVKYSAGVKNRMYKDYIVSDSKLFLSSI